MATWSTEATTAARDRSIMHAHVLPRWGAVQLGKIDHISLQEWATELGQKRSRATAAEALRLTGAVLRSAVRNRLIPFNPADDERIPRARRHDTGERVLSRTELRARLLPAVPERYRGVVATAAGAGLRWGEVAGLRADALDLDGGRLSVIRTAIEVAGHTSFKPFLCRPSNAHVVVCGVVRSADHELATQRPPEHQYRSESGSSRPECDGRKTRPPGPRFTARYREFSGSQSYALTVAGSQLGSQD
ncbi:hypothetical protein ACQPZQ_31935 [Pseudonocardia sp. CA-142604]|uniref:hypothetical protein n=1 Tax=Pseudonocardia sp. CA-142604 TaxID=3240024 RepID=UPI003D8BECC6